MKKVIVRPNTRIVVSATEPTEVTLRRQCGTCGVTVESVVTLPLTSTRGIAVCEHGTTDLTLSISAKEEPDA